jgi:hypothetical protein
MEFLRTTRLRQMVAKVNWDADYEFSGTTGFTLTSAGLGLQDPGYALCRRQ